MAAVRPLEGDFRGILRAEALATPDMHPATPEPTDEQVEAVAELLAVNPGHRVTDRDVAMVYFRGQARNRLRAPNRRAAP